MIASMISVIALGAQLGWTRLFRELRFDVRRSAWTYLATAGTRNPISSLARSLDRMRRDEASTGYRETLTLESRESRYGDPRSRWAENEDGNAGSSEDPPVVGDYRGRLRIATGHRPSRC